MFVEQDFPTKQIAITCANKEKMYNTHSGKCAYVCENGSVIDMTNTTTFTIPNISAWLIPPQELAKNGLKFAIGADGFKVWDVNGNLLPIYMRNNVPWIKLKPTASLEGHGEAYTACSSKLKGGFTVDALHEILAHSDKSMIPHLQDRVDNLVVVKEDQGIILEDSLVGAKR